VLDLAGQRMRGWEPVGAPFQVYINHEVDIPKGAQAVHGLSREFLAANGIAPRDAHERFTAYAGTASLVAFNLPYDYDKVLLPEWSRLGHAPQVRRGFCALKLMQMLVSPSPAGDYKLQSLREHYALPARDAHSALGDVQTVCDLFARVIRPLAAQRGMTDLAQLEAFASADWYPEALPFGKHKGRSFREAGSDRDLHGWLDWLSRRDDPATARMG
jgi:DNA polymerase-3 subunit epsilon